MEPLDTEADPRVVGPFELLARLGAGGMGVAYLARRIPLEGLPDEMAAAYRLVEPDHDQEADPAGLVVVKMILPRLLDHQPQARERFAREVDAVRSVVSDRVPALRGADPEAAEPWFAMDYVAGPSLQVLVKESGPLGVGPYAALGLALVDALRAIHGTKLLHRDLKPSNVVLGPDGPVVLDFGLAVLSERQSSQALTRTGDLMGTRPYMPVEQLRDTKHVEEPADVYALGATLFFALTGRPPYPVMPLMSPPKWDGVDLAFLPLLAQVLVASPSQRPDLDGVQESLFTLLADAGLTLEAATAQLQARVAEAGLTPELPRRALADHADPAVRELAQHAVDRGDAPDAPWAEDDPGFYGIVDTDEIEWAADATDGPDAPGGHPPTLVDPDPAPPVAPAPQAGPSGVPGPAPTSYPLPPPRPRDATQEPAATASSASQSAPRAARNVAARIRERYAHRGEL
ncbi:serine/threonine-protein kinase [Streptomyces pactum]|uniref:Serine/threonine protein kinase n=1 Tax=Streptomyces pactum TaxID=68249 RepID=A0A1S6JDS2_9ACTN|nr:serine/threonine-protein kinase [Streptomyces pactum]AQS69862.1 serine/threonine protein kinase [Streptomyces pactum]